MRLTRILSLAALVLSGACSGASPAPAPSPPPVATAASPRESDGGAPLRRCDEMIFTLEGIHELPWAFAFEPAHEDPMAGSAATVEAITRQLSGPEPAVFKSAVVGYADAGEADASALSQRRAEWVLAELVKQGVPPDRLEAHGLGGAPSKGLRYYAHNRFVFLETLYEYRGPVKRWEAGAFVPCERRGHERGCEPPASARPSCIP
jgi:hypothetical protein